MDQHLKKSITR